MLYGSEWARFSAAVALVWVCGSAWAQSSVTYGRITAVNR